ncbi:MAG: rRNA maturation RNase YbeY [Leptospirillum sp.]
MPVEVVNLQRKYPLDIGSLEFLANEVQKALDKQSDLYTVTIVNDRRIRLVNRMFRGKNSATDVLSFGYDSTPADEALFPDGEILISAERADRQARDQKISLEAEIVNLIIHGMCHISGYDHEENPIEAERMKKMEREISGILLVSLRKAAGNQTGDRPNFRIHGKIPD